MQVSLSLVLLASCLAACGVEVKSDVAGHADLDCRKVWASLKAIDLDEDQLKSARTILASEKRMAAAGAKRAIESPGDAVPDESSPEGKASQLLFLSLYPDVVSAKMRALEAGNYRYGAVGSLPLSLMVHEDEDPFALAWGQYLAGTGRGGKGILVFRLDKAAYPAAYDVLKTLRDERRDHEATRERRH